MEITDEEHTKHFWEIHKYDFLSDEDFDLKKSPPKPFKNEWKTFKIGRANDGDFWPQIIDLKETSKQSAFSGGRFRNCWNGGGASPKMFAAFGFLRQVIQCDMQDIKKGQFPFKYGIVHSKKHFVKRHMDDGCGDFGMNILADGQVCIFIQPTKDAMSPKDAHILISPNTWYQRTYASLILLYDAMIEDNRVRGASRGNHAY